MFCTFRLKFLYNLAKIIFHDVFFVILFWFVWPRATLRAYLTHTYFTGSSSSKMKSSEREANLFQPVPRLKILVP